MNRTDTAPSIRRLAGSNLVAQTVALGCLSFASLIVARLTGPDVVGEYALLRVLPWLTGVLLSGGLPMAAAYFLAGERGTDPSIRATVAVLAIGGAGLGAVIWLVLTPSLQRVFLRDLDRSYVAAAAVLVLTQLLTVTAKACCQGGGDLRGANAIIMVEEFAFLPAYALVLAAGSRGGHAVVLALLLGGAGASAISLNRIRRRGFFTGLGRPSVPEARRIASYGSRGQLGNLLWLLNLRFDFVLLGAIAGPATLGTYAVASKFAELMRLGPTALNYVLYPRFAAEGPRAAVAEARRLLPRATVATLLATPVLAALSVVALPLLYGPAFHSSTVAALVLLVGLSVEGGAAVASAFLWGVGRPGLNSLGMGAGVAVTVVLDLLLIPRHLALGAAAASSAAYLVTTFVLVLLVHRVARGIAGLPRQGVHPAPDHPEGADEVMSSPTLMHSTPTAVPTPRSGRPARSRIVFVGAVHEAMPVLDLLLDAHHSGWSELAAIVTVPAAESARLAGGLDLDRPARAAAVPLLTTVDLNGPTSVAALEALHPDLLVVCGWTRLLGSQLLSLPGRGCVGFHASMLPRNRGRAPVNWAMLRGEPAVGNTMMFLSAAADRGDIIDQGPVFVRPDDTCGTVYQQVGAAGARMLGRHLPALLEGCAPRRPQPTDRRPLLPRRTPDMGITDWNRPARAVHDWIRALSHPYPGAFARLDGAPVQLWRSTVPSPDEPPGPPGAFLQIEGEGVRIGTGTGSLVLTRVSRRGCPEEPAVIWFRRSELRLGDRFDPVDGDEARWALGLGHAGTGRPARLEPAGGVTT